MAENEQEQAAADAPTISNRERVRRVLIQPLCDWGMVRASRVTLADHDAMLARLVDGLAYMTDANLRGLLEVVTRHAGGPERKCWPAEITVRAWASKLQPRPWRENAYVHSVMRSAMGRNARALGYHVELFLLAKDIGPPPSRYQLNKLLDRSKDAQRKRERVEAQVARGTAVLDDVRWLEWYVAAEAACLSIIDDQDQGEAA